MSDSTIRVEELEITLEFDSNNKPRCIVFTTIGLESYLFSASLANVLKLTTTVIGGSLGAQALVTPYIPTFRMDIPANTPKSMLTMITVESSKLTDPSVFNAVKATWPKEITPFVETDGTRRFQYRGSVLDEGEIWYVIDVGRQHAPLYVNWASRRFTTITLP